MQETMTIESEGNPQLADLFSLTVKAILTLGTLHCAILNDHIPKLTPVLEKQGHLKDLHSHFFERNLSQITWNNNWVPECRKPKKTVA